MPKTIKKLPVEKVLAILRKEYPQEISLLHFANAYQLLISVMLSAQTTDKKVNQVTLALFKKFPNPQKLAKYTQGDKLKEVETYIAEVNFYKNKAKYITQTAKMLVEKYAGEVPNSIEELTHFPGVGRKSASVVLHHIYNKPAIIVDTHFGRMARRLGWTKNTNAVKIEKDIAYYIPKKNWNDASMYLNYHGRYVCKAQNPQCKTCVLYKICISEDKCD